MNKNYQKFWIFLAILWVNVLPLVGQPEIELVSIASGFDSPVDIANAGDERLFIVEKEGLIKIINADGEVEETPFLDIQSVVNDNASERGLLGLAFHPEYSTNGYFFVNYTEAGGGSVVSRYQVSENDPDEATTSSAKVILRVDQDFGNHNGGDIAFGPDGYLYIGFGDGGSGGDPNDRGQELTSLLGKMLRIDIDNGDPYAIPADNPFAEIDAVLDEIWSIGLRNPWRWSFDRETGDMWIADVGQGIVEEVSFEPAGSSGGLNYGWRCYEGDREFNLENCVSASQLTDPVFTYNHDPSGGLSITGGFVYRGQKYPLLEGHYIFGDYASGRFWTTVKEGNNFTTEVQGVLMGNSQLSSFGEGVDGEMYVAAYNQGIIYQVTETNQVTSIAEEIGEAVAIYPNPTNGRFVLSFENSRNESFELRVLDVSGKLVYSQEEIRSDKVEIDLPELPLGVYLVRLAGERVLTGKLMIRE